MPRAAAAAAAEGESPQEDLVITLEKPHYHHIVACKHFWDFCFGTTLGRFFCFAVVGVAQVLLNALVWHFLGGRTLKASIWLSYCLFIDTGTQTGIEADSSGSHELSLAVWMSVCGWLYNMVLLGQIVHAAEAVIRRMTRERFRVFVSKHVVLLGWNDKTLHFLTALQEQACLHSVRQHVVILAERDEQSMSEEVRHHFKRIRAKHGLVKVVCRQANPCDTKQLARVNVIRASKVVLLSSDPTDDAVIRSMIALATFAEWLQGFVYADMWSSERSFVATTILPHTVVLLGHRQSGRLLCLLAAQPALGAVLLRLQDRLHSVNAPPDFDGLTFAEVSAKFGPSVLIGVKSCGMPLQLAPLPDTEIEEGDELIVVAPRRPPDAGGQPARRGERLVQRLAARRGPRAQQQPHDGWERTARAISCPAAGSREQAPREMLIAGWPRDPSYMFECLDEYVAGSTAVHILSDIPVAQREEELSGCKDLHKIRLKHHVGQRTRLHDLEAVLTERLAVVVIPSERALVTGRAAWQDSECLLCAVTVLGILDGRGAPNDFQPLVICEINHTESERMVAGNSELKARCLMFRTEAQEAALMVTKMTDPTVFWAYRELLFGGLGAAPVSQVMPQGQDALASDKTTLYDLGQMVRADSGSIVLCWQAPGEEVEEVAANTERWEAVEANDEGTVFFVSGHTIGLSTANVPLRTNTIVGGPGPLAYCRHSQHARALVKKTTSRKSTDTVTLERKRLQEVCEIRESGQEDNHDSDSDNSSYTDDSASKSARRNCAVS